MKERLQWNIIPVAASFLEISRENLFYREYIKSGEFCLNADLQSYLNNIQRRFWD